MIRAHSRLRRWRFGIVVHSLYFASMTKSSAGLFQRGFALTCGCAVLLLSPAPAARAQSGSLDISFDPGDGVDQSVFALALQADGRIVIAGDFTTVDNVTRNGIARLASNGALDSSFDPGLGANDLVNAVAFQTNKAVIAGYFTHIAGTPRGRIARLNENGSLDINFAPGWGANGPVLALAVQPDGKVIIGGTFTSVNGAARTNIARLNPDGSNDSSFDPGTGVAGLTPSVRSIALQADGKVIIGGAFTSVNGTAHTNLARLKVDGSPDAGFSPLVDVVGAGVLAGINTLAVQNDGRIVVGGDFTGINGVGRRNIARLNADGSLDLNFDPGLGTDDAVSALGVQANGKVVLGGYFTRVNGISRTNVARLNANGTLDPNFQPGSGTDYPVYATALQNDGKVLIGGLFATFNGTPRSGIARLIGDTVIPSPQLFAPRRTNNIFQVSFATVSGSSYVLEYRNSLANSWMEILPGVAGDGAVKSLTDASATNSLRFYRVRVTP